jgi:hypothetical protein
VAAGLGTALPKDATVGIANQVAHLGKATNANGAQYETISDFAQTQNKAWVDQILQGVQKFAQSNKQSIEQNISQTPNTKNGG